MGNHRKGAVGWRTEVEGQMRWRQGLLRLPAAIVWRASLEFLSAWPAPQDPAAMAGGKALPLLVARWLWADRVRGGRSLLA